MMARLKDVWLALAFVLVLVFVTACSGGGASSSTAGTSVTAETSAAAGSPASGGGAIGGTVAAGEDLCGLLGAGDFAAAGVPGTTTAKENNTDDNDVYCVFAGKSAGTGGVEFDAFLAASSSDSGASYAEVSGSFVDTGGVAKAAFPDADGAALQTDTAEGFAGIAIWKGKLVFDIGIPTSAAAKDQLITLAKLVLQRASGLT
jgi:hypothetical protein